jgi:hypothetical protein
MSGRMENHTAVASTLSGRARRSPVSRPLIACAALAGALLVAALALWGHYGTAVFVETIAAGIALCL